MQQLWEDFWRSVFDQFGNDPENQRRGCLRTAAWFFMLDALMLLTGGLLLVIPGPWVWVAAGVFAALSILFFYLSSRPADDDESED